MSTGKTFFGMTEEEVLAALTSRLPEDQPIVEEYGRYLVFYEKEYLETGKVSACGALQVLAATEARRKICSGLDIAKAVTEIKPGQRVISSFKMGEDKSVEKENIILQ